MRLEGEATENIEKINDKERYWKIGLRFGIKV
jgi:hypothetical protein